MENKVPWAESVLSRRKWRPEDRHAAVSEFLGREISEKEIKATVDELQRRWRENEDPTIYDGEKWIVYMIFGLVWGLDYLELIRRREPDLLSARTVLDYSCGFGFTTSLGAMLWPDSRWWGSNISAGTQLDFNWWLAKRLGLPNLSFVRDQDIESLPYDAATCFEVFEHVEEPVELAQRLLQSRCDTLIESSSFTVWSGGHLSSFVVDGRRLTPRQTANAFPAGIRRHGFRCDRLFWNNRPRVWKREEKKLVT